MVFKISTKEAWILKRLFDFKCPDGHVFEDLVAQGTTTTRCDCGLEAKRIISPVRSQLDPISGDFPDATKRWAKARHSHIQYERRQTS